MSHLKDLTAVAQIGILPEDELVKTPILGRKYHLSWASNRGMVWVLHQVMNDKVILKTPRTHKQLIANTKDLREINKHIIYNARARYNNKKQST